MFSDYRPLSEEQEMKLGADEARIQAIADLDNAILQDPMVQSVLGDDSDDPIDEDELNEIVKAINP
jgi:hypothetical protein